MSHNIYNPQVSFGTMNEIISHTTIANFIGVELAPTPNKYCYWDYQNEDKSILVELKSRTYSYDVFPDWLITAKKFDKLMNQITEEGKEVYLFYKMTDGLYYYKLNTNSYEELIKHQGDSLYLQITKHRVYRTPVINYLMKKTLFKKLEI